VVSADQSYVTFYSISDIIVRITFSRHDAYCLLGNKMSYLEESGTQLTKRASCNNNNNKAVIRFFWMFNLMLARPVLLQL